MDNIIGILIMRNSSEIKAGIAGAKVNSKISSGRRPLDRQIEALEPRLVLSGLGVGTGQDLKKVKFRDADGDLVKIKVNKHGPATFDILLDGSAKNRADISSIVINDANDNTKLQIRTVTRVLGSLHQDPHLVSPGFTIVGSIESSNSLESIALRSAVASKITVDGDIQNLSMDLRQGQFLGVDSGGDVWDKMKFWTVNVAGDLDTMTLRGRVDTSNDLGGDINVGGDLGFLDAAYSDLLGKLEVGGTLGKASLSNIYGPVSAASIGEIAAKDVSGSITSATNFNRLLSTGNINGDISVQAAGGSLLSVLVDGVVGKGSAIDVQDGNLVIDANTAGSVMESFQGTANASGSIIIHAREIAANATLTAGENLSATANTFGGSMTAGAAALLTSEGGDFAATVTAASINAGGSLTLKGGNFSGVLHATEGNIGDVTLSDPASVFSGKLFTDNGTIGKLTAGSFVGAYVESAQGIGATKATAGGIDVTYLAHGGDIANLQVANSVGGISGSLTAENGSVGNLTGAKVNGLVVNATNGIGATVVTSGDFNGAFTTTGGDIGDILLQGDNGTLTGSLKALGGNVGSLTAGTVSGLNVIAQGNIGATLVKKGGFDATYRANTGDIGGINVQATTGTFTADLTAVLGSVGNISAANFSGVKVTAGSGIGTTTVTKGNFDGTYLVTGDGGNIGNITMVGAGGIFTGSLTAQAGAVGNLTGSNFNGVTVSAATGIGSTIVTSGGFNGSYITSTGNIGGITMLGTAGTFTADLNAVAGSMGNIVAANFSGVKVTAGSGIGSTTVTKGNFDATYDAVGGNIGNITMAGAGGTFTASLTAEAGAVGNLTGSNFNGVTVSAATGIGTTTVNSGNFNGSYVTAAGDVGDINVKSVSGDFSGTIKAVSGSVGNLTSGKFSSVNVIAQSGIGSTLVTSGGFSGAYSTAAGNIGPITMQGTTGSFVADLNAATGAVGDITAANFAGVKVSAGTGIGTTTVTAGNFDGTYTTALGDIGAITMKGTSGSFTGTLTAETGAVGALTGMNFNGLTVNAANGIGKTTVNSGNFYATYTATGGNIGDINAKSPTSDFSATLKALGGSVGSLTAGKFTAVSVFGQTGIGATFITSGGFSGAYTAATGDIGAITMQGTTGTFAANLLASTGAVGDISAANFSGVKVTAGTGIGTTTITAGNFDAVYDTVAGNIGNITMNSTSGAFTASLTAETGSVGNLSGMNFNDVTVIAQTGIGTTTVTKGDFRANYITNTGGIGSISDQSLTGVFSASLTATGSSIGALSGPNFTDVKVISQGNVGLTTVTRGNFNASYTAGGDIAAVTLLSSSGVFNADLLALGSVGNLTAGSVAFAKIQAGTGIGNTNVQNGSFLATYSTTTGNIGNITVAGNLGVFTADLTAVAGSIGNISGPNITGTTLLAKNGIGTTTVTKGNFSADYVTATGNIGAVSMLSSTGVFSANLTALTGGVGPLTAGSISKATVTAQTGIGATTVLTGGFDAVYQTATGDIGAINVQSSTGIFSGNVTATTGAVGALTAGSFAGAKVTAATGIGATTVATGDFNAYYATAGGNIGNVNMQGSTGVFSANLNAFGGSVGTLSGGSFLGAVVNAQSGIGATTVKTGNFDATYTTVTGNIGSVTLKSSTGIFSGNLTALTGAVGDLTAGSFVGAKALAATGIGNTTAATGNFAANYQVTGGSIGNITALGTSSDFSGNLLASGNVGDLTAASFTGAIVQVGGKIGDTRVTNGNFNATYKATGDIGFVTVVRPNGVFSATLKTDGAVGNLTSPIFNGAVVQAGTGIGNITADSTLASSAGGVPAAFKASIDDSSFLTKTGNIGTITAKSGASGDGILNASFEATKGAIGAITATTASTTGGRGIAGSTFTSQTGIGAVVAKSTDVLGGDAINGSQFVVTGFSNSGTTVLGNVTADSTGANGIVNTQFTAQTGNLSDFAATAQNGTGIKNTSIQTENGSIGSVVGTAVKIGDGIDSSVIAAGNGLTGAGGINAVIGKAFIGSGITNTLVTSGTGGIAAVTGIETATAADLAGNLVTNVAAIKGSQFLTTGNIGAIIADSAGADGMLGAKFSADGSIQQITAATNSTSSAATAINNSIIRAGGNIGNISASTAVVGSAAILGTATPTVELVDPDGAGPVPSKPLAEVVYGGGTIISAGGNVGNIAVAKGDIRGTVFLAGYDIGSDLTHDGFLSGNDFATTSAVTMGDVTVSNGDILNSVFQSGVVSNDNTFGDGDDTLQNTGSSIGTITAAKNGQLVSVVVESGTVAGLNVGQIRGLNVEVAGDLGGLVVKGNFVNEAAVAQAWFKVGGNMGPIDVQNLSTSGGDGIVDSVFAVGGDLTSVNVVVAGGDTGVVAGINKSAFLVDGNIGDITVTGTNTTAAFQVQGIVDTQITADADADGNGTIGNVTVTLAAKGATNFGVSNSDITAADGIGNIAVGVAGGAAISNSDFGANTDGDATGAIGTVTAISLGTNIFAYGIDTSTFGAGSGIGKITVSSAGDDAIWQSNFVADNDGDGVGGYGDISGITTGAEVTADGIDQSTFLGAGYGAIIGKSSTDSGIEQSAFTATNGVIGDVTAQSVNGNAIFSSAFIAGSIGNINASTSATVAAINQGYFRAANAGGSIASIVATGQVGGNSILGSVFTSAGNIGNITTTGTVNSSKFLAGIDTGSDFVVDGDEVYAAGKSIGTVNINGDFISSDIVASVFAGADNTWGSVPAGPDGETNVGGGGLIGQVTITGATYSNVPIVGGNNAIEAQTIVGATIGGVVVTSPGYINFPDVVIRVV